MFARFKHWRASVETEHVLSLTAYVLGILWGLSIIIFPSRGISELLSIPYVFAYLWASAAIVGGFIAITGSLRKDNLLRELLGLQILSLAPAIYGVAMLILSIIQMITAQQVTTFSVSIMSFIAFVLLRKRAARLKLRVIEVKQTDEGGQF